MLYACIVLILLGALLPFRQLECFRLQVYDDKWTLAEPRITFEASGNEKCHSVRPRVYRSGLFS
jgi:hypothetical protein